jgi:hypothetical protein
MTHSAKVPALPAAAQSWFNALWPFRRPTGLRTLARLQPIGCGDNLILSVGRLTAGEDAIALLNAVQADFPGSRIHLLAGFGQVDITRGPDRDHEGEQADNGGYDPRTVAPDTLGDAAAQATEAGPQGNVVLLRYCSGGRIVAVSIPPKQQG